MSQARSCVKSARAKVGSARLLLVCPSVASLAECHEQLGQAVTGLRKLLSMPGEALKADVRGPLELLRRDLRQTTVLLEGVRAWHDALAGLLADSPEPGYPTNGRAAPDRPGGHLLSVRG